MNDKPRLVFFVTEDWYFCSHRLPIAVAARHAGYDVTVVTRVRAHGDVIRNAGLNLVPFEMSRRGNNPLRELACIWRLTRIYSSLRPDIVHHVAMKPVLYGTLAARLAQVPHIVNALAGLGFIFSSESLYARLLRPTIRLMLGKVLRCGTVIVQNPDDAVLVGTLGVSSERVRTVRSTGVDLTLFRVMPEADGIPHVMFIGRMLRDKGVLEFVMAARQLRTNGAQARFVLVGDTDPGNPAAIPRPQLIAWQAEGNVEWWGHRDDMPQVMSQAHIVCLPSYREGLPKVLVEAAACGRPIVTTNVPGCREAVRNGENGLLVPLRDINAMVEAIGYLIKNREVRERMGRRGREIAQSEFSVERVTCETLSIYRELSSR